VVGGHLLCHPRQLQRPHRGNDVIGEVVSDWYVDET
jgi:hypothetical protein